MLKQLVSALTAVCCFATAALAQAAGNDSETAKFYYTQNGETLNVSLRGSINKESRAADAILAVYDGGALISTTTVHMDEDIQSLSMGDFTITLPYAPEAPLVKSFLWASDGSCEPLENVSQLSNVPGSAVEWYGWVVETPRSQMWLNSDEIEFLVLDSSDTDISSHDKIIAKTGNTDIDGRLFEYVKASVIIDDNSGEYIIMDYEPLSNEQTAFFYTEDIITDDPDIGTSYTEAGKLPVRTDSGRTDYSLASDVQLYINGVYMYDVNEDMIGKFILDNPSGTVKLVDMADDDGKTDGIFDCIMVSYYADGAVSSVSLEDTQNMICFKSNDADITDSCLEWDSSDDDIYVSFTDTNGDPVDPSAITEYDVLSIAYDVSYDFMDSYFYDVIVSRNVVHGAPSSADEQANTVVVNGITYPMGRMILAGDIPIGEECTFFIDAFGYIAYYEKGSVIPPKPIEPDIPLNEFSFNGVGSTMYISSVQGANTIEGALLLDTSGEPKQLSAEVELSKDGIALYSKSFVIPAGAEKLVFNGNALECSGEPDSAALYIKDGDNILYTKELGVTSSLDIYTVRGRITDTFKNDTALADDEAYFLIEYAEDFDGSGPIGIYGLEPQKKIIKTNIIDAEDMLFMYSEAVIAKESDGSYRLISLMPLSPHTESFPAELLESFDSYGLQGGALYVYESENSSSRTIYRLSSDAELYVNGICVGSVEENQDMLYYAMDDIRLLDASNTASTATDGYYDYVFIKCYSE